LKRDVTEAMEVYELHKAIRAIDSLVVDDLSRWYVKLVRDRLWKEGDDVDKNVAFKVLHEALSTCSSLLAPITPHISEAMHLNLDRREESVHMVEWPTYNQKWVDEDLDKGMDVVREISEVVARIRQESNINLRWPLRRIIIRSRSDEVADALVQLKAPLMSQNNLKSIQMVPAGEEWDEMILSVVPNPNAIGKVYRQWSSKIAVLLKNRPAKAIKAGIDKGEYSLGIEGQLVKILPNMVSFTSTLPPDVISAEVSEGIVYLDLEETPALEAEGFAREVIRRIQQMRKDMSLQVEEFIRIEIECSRKLGSAIDTWQEHISRETRARRLEVAESPRGEYIVEWNVAGESFLVGITSMKMKESLDVLTSVPGISMDKAINLFDSGYNSIESLEAASQEDFALVEGITKLDAKRVYDQFHKGESAPAQPQTASSAAQQAATPSASTHREPEEPSMNESLQTPREDAVPEPPATPVRELERSFSYLVEEDKPETSYNLFISTLEKGIKGYCITRNYPAKIRSKFNLKDVPIIWLSNVGRDNAIRPKDLEKLSLSLEQFLSQPDGGIVLLDGLEYLITNNNFISVLRLIQSLRDQVAINQSILLIAVNRSTLESHQLNLLEREVDHTFTG
ncbi:MAG: DUF835 domain-containing protein, partial [Thermoplasmata archaeon]